MGTHTPFVRCCDNVNQIPHPSLCISSLFSPLSWQLPPLKATTQLDMLVTVDSAMPVLVASMVDMVLILDTVHTDMPPELMPPHSLPPHLPLPQSSPPQLLPQSPPTTPSQLPVYSKKLPLLNKLSSPSNNGDTKSNTKYLQR